MVSIARLQEQFDRGLDELRTFCRRLREAEGTRSTYSGRLREVALAGRHRTAANIMSDLRATAARELPSLGDGEYRTFLLGLLDESPSQHDSRMDSVFGRIGHDRMFAEAECEDGEPPVDPIFGGSANDRLFGANDECDPAFGQALAVPAAQWTDYHWGRFQEHAGDKPSPDPAFDHLFVAGPAGAVQAAKSDPEYDIVFGS